MEGWGTMRIESQTVRAFCVFPCPWCGAKVFPQFYIEKYKITLCKRCRKCYCKKCLLYYEGADTLDYLLCDAMKVQKLYQLSDTDSFLDEIDKYSNEYLLEIKDAWEYQNRKVDDEQCCLNCFISFNVSCGVCLL
ncbi:uncharacterized protein LOC127751285 [Frankliniella occidentalis]|uniref:Uncharacterized protein LOC127751285 n=1 Tax=Frankliniella occidentalis TaxID=133901 RepID=A0A9C6X791_FRAOC|nr:uncharacterized protein LOC127751285 [Frankliniella occidentalis]